MIRNIGAAAAVLGLVAAMPLQQAKAGDESALTGAILGGALGAIVGGAATGKAGGAAAGAAIGAATGAIVGSQAEERHGRYVWHDGRCWVREHGDYIQVHRRHCR